MEAEFGSLHSDLELGGVDMTTYMSSPWSTPLSSVSSSPPSTLSTSSSQAISALEDSSLEQRKVHLQQLLTCLQKEVEEAEGSRDDLSECSPKKDIHSTEEEAAPPRPGTIAEREHRKWASAPPMPDNPYSPERISERLRSINLKKSLEASRGSCSDTSIDFPEFQSESESSEVVVPKVTINCGGKYLNPKKYSRDYYINNDSDSGRHVVHRNKDRDDERKQPNKGEQIDTIKENEDLDRRKKGLLLVEAESSQPQEFIRKNEKCVMQGTEVAKCLTHLFSDSEQKFSDPESDDDIHQAIEKSPPKKDMCTINNTSTLDMKDLNNEVLPTSAMLPLGGFMNGSHSSECVEQDKKVSLDNVKHIAETSSDNFKVDLIIPESCGTLSPEPKSLPIQMPEKFPSLPSVRRLARHFSGASKGEKNEKNPISKKKKKVSKEVIIVKKTAGSEARTDPPLQVHSLTARSISREFREGLRQSQQIPLGKPVANPSEKLENHKRSSDEQMQQPESVDQIEVEPRPFPRKCLSKDDPVLDSHCEALLVNYPKTSNGTNSHEGTATADSITPEMDGLFLRNVEGSIAFWERLSPQCGSSSNNQKDV